LHKQRNGRYVVRPADSLLRVLVTPGKDGMIELATRDSRQASIVGAHWNAVQQFLRTGDSSGLASFHNVRIDTIDGASVPLLTDPAALTRLANAGVFSFESIYSKAD
jgi:hypothetical protein